MDIEEEIKSLTAAIHEYEQQLIEQGIDPDQNEKFQNVVEAFGNIGRSVIGYTPLTASLPPYNPKTINWTLKKD